MPLIIRLDAGTKDCLAELLAETGQDKSSLIRERWQQLQPLPSITQQLGGHPESFLDTLPLGSSERGQRRLLLTNTLTARRTERH